MSIIYTYTQKRKQFGKTCQFTNIGPILLLDIESDPNLRAQFIHTPLSEKETQLSKEMSLHEVNTLNKETDSRGMNHVIGGWPGDVDPKDEDQVARFKKKIHKDESFINTIKKLGSLVENFLMENNSVDIYEEYFIGEKLPDDPVNQFKILSVFRDYSEKERKVLDLSWALDGCKLAAAHAISESLADSGNPFSESYVWDIENCNQPYSVVLPQGALTCVEYSPRDLELLLGGYESGQIGLWDIRAGGYPRQITPAIKSHKERVTDVKWITSKTGLEFYSCSTDGKLVCWDSRNLSSPCEILQFDLNVPKGIEENETYGITCIEYDPSLPHRFTLGTEEGTILSCNRKFKEMKEMITSCYSTHTVPIISITRNAFFPKLFASCCAWDIKIWSEDLTVSPILTLRSRDGYCADATWTPLHASFLFVTKTTGHLELWDMLVKSHEPVLSFKLESNALTCVYTKQQGEHLVCGSASGCTHLLHVPEYSTTKQERNQVAAMIDREGKREKFLDGTQRERKLKAKIKNTEIHSPIQSIISTPSPRHKLSKSPIPPIITSPSPIAELVNEEAFNLEDKMDSTEDGEGEFISVFDPNLKADDDDTGEYPPEKALFDTESWDVLSTILDMVKE